MSESEVLRILPSPIGEVWMYRDNGSSLASVQFAGNIVDSVHAGGMSALNAVRVGMTKEQVIGQVGATPAKNLIYTRSKNDSSYHVRIVALRDGIVVQRISEFYVD